MDFTSPMINGFPFQFIQDFNVQWANFTAADTGLESVTVGGVTKLAGDSSPWAINSSSPVTGFATFGTSAPAIVNSNVVFQHTEYGEEEDFGGGGPGGGGGGPIPVTTNDFVNLSVTIVAAANVGSFDVNPLVANAASTVFGAAWISGDSSFSHEIKHFTLTYNTSIIADLGLDYLRIYDESISATTTLIFDQSNWQNIGDFPYIRFGALIAGPVGVVSQDVTFSIEFFNGTIEDHVVTLSVERTGPDNVTVPDLALSAVVFEAVNVSDLALSVVVSNAPEAIA
ncbi:MAG: hypothetical protein KAH03_00815, partial [Cocleimonas sp.]|nr:hypothetical protein [Cocleimonas sp.]